MPFDIDAQLERHTILTTSMDKLSEVAQSMGNVTNAGVRVDWLDGIL